MRLVPKPAGRFMRFVASPQILGHLSTFDNWAEGKVNAGLIRLERKGVLENGDKVIFSPR